MSHNIQNIAYLGSRNDVWHRIGEEMKPGMTIEAWAKSAGLDWTAIKVPAVADLSGPEFAHLSVAERGLVKVDGARHVVRSDNGHVLGYVSDRYQPVQPAEVLDWFEHYIAEDKRFQIDVAGSLKQGEIIWATATYRDTLEIGGDKHIPRVLMTTTFDGTGSTINQATMTRVVCNNTLNASLCDKRAIIRSRHNTKFDAKQVREELATLAQSFDQFKRMGDAMAQTEMKKAEISKFFKSLLEIPFDAKSDDISTQKRNSFAALSQAYAATLLEGTTPETSWAALQAVTRYVDHEKTVRNGNGSEDAARFYGAQFGSGAQMKAAAVQYLTTDTDSQFQTVLANTPLRRSA